jgi:exosortase A-associated hydrolase 2
MNKSRKLLADLGRELVARGVAVVLPDLFGTGDSDGDFSESSIEAWLQDLELSVRFTSDQGIDLQAVVATRLGCALVVEAASRGVIPAVNRSVFWAPVVDGARHLNQFLRLRVAASMMGGEGRESLGDLRSLLAAGHCVEVAGYGVSPSLAAGLDALRIESIPAELGTLDWVEVLRDAESPLPAPASRLIRRATESGQAVNARNTIGEPFWASSEIVRNSQLVDLTVAALTGASRGRQ